MVAAHKMKAVDTGSIDEGIFKLRQMLAQSVKLFELVSAEEKGELHIPWTLFEISAFNWISDQSLLELMTVDLPRWLEQLEQSE